MFRFLCVVPDNRTKGGTFWRREVVFPCFPYPGLVVGSLGRVKEVHACQGDLDGGGSVEVHFAPNCLHPDILETHGWEYVE